MARYWIAVASADHVRRGLAEGIMQVCHGKGAPLKRLKPGDGVVYYSPTQGFHGRDRLQSFIAIGKIGYGEPYKVDMGDGFIPYRRDVDWAKARAAPIRPLLHRLEFTAGKSNWGYAFRFGLLEVPAHDFRVIAEAMGSEYLVSAAEYERA
jgi:EVE domain